MNIKTARTRWLLTCVAAGAIGAALICNADARADNQQGNGDQAFNPPPPAPTVTVVATPTPTPGATSSSETHGGSSNPGNSCALRLGTRNTPPGQSPANLYNTSGNSGWPFGQPGQWWYTPPTGAPNVGCSR